MRNSLKTSISVIKVLDDRGDLRVLLSQNPDKIISGREHRGRGDKHHHDLPCDKPPFHQAGLTGKETVIDAYCGIGTISLTMAEQARQVIGVEVVPQAVADAREPPPASPGPRGCGTPPLKSRWSSGCSPTAPGLQGLDGEAPGSRL